jgi:putative redox protein
MDHRPFSRHSIVATPEGGQQFSISLREHRLLTDQPERAGGTNAGPTPLELLGASLSGCVALYVHKYCQSEGLQADGLAVEVRPFWKENPGRVARFDIIIHLPEAIPVEHRAQIERVAQSCPVHHTLTLGPEITLQLRAASLVGA